MPKKTIFITEKENNYFYIYPILTLLFESFLLKPILPAISYEIQILGLSVASGRVGWG